MTKMMHQLLLVSGLQIFTGKVPAAYANQKEFFFTSIQNISESLIDLKKETLKDACERFGKKLDEGKATDMAIAEYCCLYRIPLKEEDTLTPFSLLHVDVVITASYRLLSNVRRAMGA